MVIADHFAFFNIGVFVKPLSPTCLILTIAILSLVGSSHSLLGQDQQPLSDLEVAEQISAATGRPIFAVAGTKT